MPSYSVKSFNENTVSMKKITLPFILLLAPVSLFAQVQGNYLYNQKSAYRENAGRLNSTLDKDRFANSVSGYLYGSPQVDKSFDSVTVFSAKVLTNVQADEYVAIFSLIQNGTTLASCGNLMQERIDRFFNALKPLGVEEKDFYVDFISQVPTFEMEIQKKLFSQKSVEVPTGFELRKNIHVRFKKSGYLDKIMVSAAESEIYDLVRMDYVVAESEKIYEMLRNECIEILKKKQEAYKRLGVNYTAHYQTVAENITAIYPDECYRIYNTFGMTSYPGGKIKEVARNTTSFYDKPDYKGYDKVINPSITEPAVQFIYSLSMKYSLKKQ